MKLLFPLLVIGLLLISGNCSSKKQSPFNQKSTTSIKPTYPLGIDPNNYGSRNAYQEDLFYASPELDVDYELEYYEKYDDDDVIEFKIGNKKIRFVSNEEGDEDEFVYYYYNGTSDKYNYHLVSAEKWDSYESYIINAKTGHIDTIVGDYPIVNENQDMICAFTLDFEDDVPPYDFWKRQKNGSWKKIKSILNTDWIPFDGRWVDAEGSIFVFETQSAEEYYSDSDDYTYVKYEF